jgi:hypothetical protein
LSGSQQRIAHDRLCFLPDAAQMYFARQALGGIIAG